MTSSRRNLAVGGAAIFLCALVLANTAGSQAQEPEGNYGVGIPDVFVPKYLAYRAQQLKSSTPQVMRIRLGYVKGLSRSFTAMAGEVAVNLGSGSFNVSLNGLTPQQTYSVWLVDRPARDPALSDTVFGLVTFVASGASTVLKSTAPLSLPAGFTIDRAVVVPGSLSSGPALAAGTVNVFQKIFFRRLSLANESAGQGRLPGDDGRAEPLRARARSRRRNRCRGDRDGRDLGSSDPGVRRAVLGGRVLRNARKRRGGLPQAAEARPADLEGRKALLRGDVQRQRPHLRHLSSRQQQLHDRHGIHRHAAGQRSAVRGGVQPGAGAARTPAPDAVLRLDPGEPRRPGRSREEVRDARRASHARPAGLDDEGHRACPVGAVRR